MLAEEPSLKMMLSMDEICGADQVLASAKKRQSHDTEAAVVVVAGDDEGDGVREKDKGEDIEKSKGTKQRRLSLP